jgi:hypothetical protein
MLATAAVRFGRRQATAFVKTSRRTLTTSANHEVPLRAVAASSPMLIAAAAAAGLAVAATTLTYYQVRT